ncbi:MAG: hypothetical protein EXS09_07465 [Gemmataceae bacterium]|nr:hypothetical protein [Gemmataceae bacterium]
MPVSILDECVSAIHHLSAAAWFGALVYRAFFLDPKARRFFDDGAKYERFSLELAHGMRFVVMVALATCGLTGFFLIGSKWNSSDAWVIAILGKTGLWIVACALFAYISWVFWPRRVFAVRSEWPRVHRQGLILTVTMIAIAASGFLLGQTARALREMG